jgi:hypothetical protein
VKDEDLLGSSLSNMETGQRGEFSPWIIFEAFSKSSGLKSSP